jgi:NodT family efflux transporter outer membrane factor (OMF) lipoprotein
MRNHLLKLFLLLLVTGCGGAPVYKKVEIALPDKFKGAGLDWNIINPKDEEIRGAWWEIFNDEILNDLQQKLNENNQNIIAAGSAYRQSLALVEKTRAGYLPAINASISITRAREITNGKPATQSGHSSGLGASWEPDLWGNVGSTLDADMAAAGVTKAQLASARLSGQAALAQYYFELRVLDKGQILLDKIVSAYKELLKYTENRYASGLSDQGAILQINQQLQSAEVLAENNKINRAQFQHAIAVLTGQSPSSFIWNTVPEIHDPKISIPVGVPSTLLERRPDIAEAERNVAQANAEIGVAKSAFFPTLTLSGSLERKGGGVKNLLSLPDLIWSVGPELALNLTNLAAYKSTKTATLENYNAKVALYRQTVLTALQDVEDSLVELRSLAKQMEMQKLSEEQAKRNFDLVEIKYIAGTIDYSELLLAQIGYFEASKNVNDTLGLKITASIGLIKALGGGW